MQTQPPKQGRGSFATHFVAFAAGGASVMLAGQSPCQNYCFYSSTQHVSLAYSYYHYSGLASLVAKANAAKARYVEVRAAWKDNQPRTASDAVAFLRSLSRSRSGPVPDTFVDMVAQFQGAHEEDIDRILFGACDDIQAIIAEPRGAAPPESDGGVAEQGLTSEDRRRIGLVVQQRAAELREKIRARRADSVSPMKDGSEDRRLVSSALARWKARHEGEQKPSEDDGHA